jgi:RimJ/RimL family protein N-acetyltransferase
MVRLPLLAQPLEHERVRLRDAAERDIPEILIAHQDDPELHRRLVQERPPSAAELGRLAESEAAARAAGSRATLTILAPGSDLCLGQVSVGELDAEQERARLWIWVAPQARRGGLGAGALVLASRWLLGPCGLHRLQILCEPENPAMLRAGARAGFQPEGVLHGYLRCGSRRVDVVSLARVAGDPEPA